jgi:DNA-binding NtrC family response regulator
MTSKKDLEETIKEKIAPMLEQTMEKSLGVHIPKVEHDISDKLANPLTQLYIPFNLPFQTAKKAFKKEFFKKELKLHLGNISHLAKTLGLDRRSIHRTIKELEINIDIVKEKESQQKLVDETIRDTLNQYKDILKPEKIQKMYEEVPTLSKNIAKLIPHHDFTWKEVEQEFEKQFLEHALKENKWNITATAKQIKIRVETLHRKIRRLHLRN